MWMRRNRAMSDQLALASLPLAILATRTRGVWLSFAASVALLALCAERGLRRVCLGLIGIGGIAFFAVLLVGDGLKERLVERSPVEFRMAAYQAGWEMFLERPFAGWGTNQVQSQLPRRISTFAGQSFAVHNTYLDVLLEHGLLGLGLYLWLVARLFQLRKGGAQEEPDTIASVRSLWPLLLGVYFVNASFVVMNYQFVNGLLFTLAGILAAHSPSTGVAKEFSEEKRRPPSVFPTTDGRR
jgi:O-antigen ligase